jgi:hypothetical protein
MNSHFNGYKVAALAVASVSLVAIVATLANRSIRVNVDTPKAHFSVDVGSVDSDQGMNSPHEGLKKQNTPVEEK